MLEKILKFIYPPNYTCLCCGRDVFDSKYLICNKCIKTLPYITKNVCAHCGVPMISDGSYCKFCKGKDFVIDRAVAPFEYSGVISKLIKDFKYENSKYIANSLSKFMADHYIKTKLFADVIIPVPLCNKRLKQRGYNQSELLSESLSKYITVPVLNNSLIRVKETPPQTTLNYADRKQNLSNAFEVTNKEAIQNKVVLLVDDIYTTGATAYECAKALKEAGAKVVYVLTVAHTIFKEKENDQDDD